MSGRFLLIDDEPELLELISLLIEDEIEGAKFEFCKSGNTAVSLLKNDHQFDAILCDYNMIDGTGGDVYSFCVQSNFNIPFILISGGFIKDSPEFSTFEQTSGLNLFLAKPFNEDQLLSHLKSILNSKVSVHKKSEYIEIPSFLVSLHPELSPECFIEVNGKMVSIAKPGEHYLEQINHFIGKKDLRIFIFDKDFRAFVSKLTQKLYSLEKKNINGFDPKDLKFESNILDSLKIGPIVQEIVQKEFERAFIEVLNLEVVKEKMDTVFKESSLFYAHSLLTGYIGIAIHKGNTWSSESLVNSHIRACLIHDLFIPVNIFESEIFETDQNRGDDFYQHTVAILKTATALWPKDLALEIILKQHHELPNGKGGPLKLESNDLSVPSATFILSHFLATELLRTKIMSSKQIAYVLSINEQFSSGAFSQAFKTAKSIWPS